MRNLIAAVLGKYNENRQNNELRGPKWLLGLCRSKRADIWLSVLRSAVYFNVFVAVVQSFEMQFRSLLRSGLGQWFDDCDVLQ